jgi:hypothetical protein
MEPLTTIALLVSFGCIPATIHPNWVAERRAISAQTLTTLNPIYSGLGLQQVVTTTSIVPDCVTLAPDVQNDLYTELASYASLKEGWDGQGSVTPSGNDLDRAARFAESLPSGLPLPRPMVSGGGEVGLYWDDESAYADIQFEPEGTISLYVRNRVTGQERFFDGVHAESLKSAWYFDALSPLVPSYALAA